MAGPLASTSRVLIGRTAPIQARSSARCICSTSWRAQQQQQQQQRHEDDDTSTEPQQRSSTSASSYLHAQAMAEEQELDSKKRREPDLPQQLADPAWDGDEPQERAIRRILSDSYKPLRIKGFKKKIPAPKPLPDHLFPAAPAIDDSADLSESPPVDRAQPAQAEPARPKEPWEYTFKAPSWHTEARVRSEKMLKIPTKEQRSPKASVRLSQALEKAYDHQSGYHKVQVPANEHSGAGEMVLYEGFVESKIAQARARGYFKNIKGRGKPIARDPRESNPFIPRDEFLINRIVQGQGAAPPWVDLQNELEEALTLFRVELRDRWTRRAVRMKSLGGVSRTDIELVRTGWRDAEWEDRERKFHELSIDSINTIVRRYNGVAPYTVRKGLLTVEGEVHAAVKASAPAIVAELERRLAGGSKSYTVERDSSTARETLGEEAEEEEKAIKEGMWVAFKRLVRQVVGTERAGEMRA